MMEAMLDDRATPATAVKAPGRAWLRPAPVLVALTVLPAAVRLLTVDRQSLWLDESYAIEDIHRSFGAMLSWVAAKEGSPPLYFVLIWGWVKALGSGTVALRSLSVLAGIATVPLVYLAGSTLASRRAGLVAAALTVGAARLALLPLALGGPQHSGTQWIGRLPLHLRLAQVPDEFIFGPGEAAVSHRVAAALALATAAAAAVLVVRFGDRRGRRAVGLWTALAAGCIAGPLLASLVGADYLDARNLMVAWVPLVLVIGARVPSAQGLACWWGGVCALPRQLIPGGMPRGFTQIERRRVGPFIVARYVATRPHRVSLHRATFYRVHHDYAVFFAVQR